MSHGSHESHAKVVELVREYNASGRGCLAILLDTKGPEVRSGDVPAPLELAPGDRLTFTTVEGADGSGNRVLGAWLVDCRGRGGGIGEGQHESAVGQPVASLSVCSPPNCLSAALSFPLRLQSTTTSSPRTPAWATYCSSTAAS